MACYHVRVIDHGYASPQVAMKQLFPIVLSLIFTSAVVSATADEVDCSQAGSTLAIEECSREEVGALETELDKYLAAARQHLYGDEAVLSALDQAQQSWLDYRREHCLAVRELWAGGSIRGVMTNQCLLHQTRQRLWDIWETYLTFMDSTPPLLPEPPR